MRDGRVVDGRIVHRLFQQADGFARLVAVLVCIGFEHQQLGILAGYLASHVLIGGLQSLDRITIAAGTLGELKFPFEL